MATAANSVLSWWQRDTLWPLSWTPLDYSTAPPAVSDAFKKLISDKDLGLITADGKLDEQKAQLFVEGFNSKFKDPEELKTSSVLSAALREGLSRAAGDMPGGKPDKLDAILARLYPGPALPPLNPGAPLPPYTARPEGPHKDRLDTIQKYNDAVKVGPRNDVYVKPNGDVISRDSDCYLRRIEERDKAAEQNRAPNSIPGCTF